MNAPLVPTDSRPTLARIIRPDTLRLAAGRDERLVAALCHVTILLNTVTAVGGLALCALAYLLARTRAPFVAAQASRALIYQSGVWGVTIGGWLIYRLLPDWLGNILLLPLGALVWFGAIVWAMWRAGRCL